MYHWIKTSRWLNEYGQRDQCGNICTHFIQDRDTASGEEQQLAAASIQTTLR